MVTPSFMSVSASKISNVRHGFVDGMKNCSTRNTPSQIPCFPSQFADTRTRQEKLRPFRQGQLRKTWNSWTKCFVSTFTSIPRRHSHLSDDKNLNQSHLKFARPVGLHRCHGPQCCPTSANNAVQGTFQPTVSVRSNGSRHFQSPKRKSPLGDGNSHNRPSNTTTIVLRRKTTNKKATPKMRAAHAKHDRVTSHVELSQQPMFPCWVGGGGQLNMAKKWKMLKMAWKCFWQIFTMLSYPPPPITQHGLANSIWAKRNEKLLKMAWKWSWLIFSMFSWPPPVTQHIHM